MDWPTHYTPQDSAAVESTLQWIKDREFTQAALARLARVSATSLNQILKGVYVSSPTKMLLAVASAMRHHDEASGHAMAPVETSVFRAGNAACDMARRYRNFSVFSAVVGTGKTFTMKHYAATHPNTYLIEASPTMSQQSLVKRLALAVCNLQKGSIADKFDAIIDSLQDTDSLIIVDEAETMTPAQLHTIRRIRDMARIGIVLAGTEYLSGLIQPQQGQFDQIRSRTGFWPETIRRIKEEDGAALVQAAFGAEEVSDEVVTRLFQYSHGSARMLVEGLIAAVKEHRVGRALDVHLVDAVAKQALCLQPLPPLTLRA